MRSSHMILREDSTSSTPSDPEVPHEHNSRSLAIAMSRPMHVQLYAKLVRLSVPLVRRGTQAIELRRGSECTRRPCKDAVWRRPCWYLQDTSTILGWLLVMLLDSAQGNYSSPRIAHGPGDPGPLVPPFAKGNVVEGRLEGNY